MNRRQLLTTLIAAPIAAAVKPDIPHGGIAVPPRIAREVLRSFHTGPGMILKYGSYTMSTIEPVFIGGTSAPAGPSSVFTTHS